MSDDFDRWTSWLANHGVDFTLHQNLIAGPDQVGVLVPDPRPRAAFEINADLQIDECRRPDLGVAADHATRLIAQCLVAGHVAVAGRVALDLACGTGCLATLMARLGARETWCSDALPEALDCARVTAELAGVETQLVEANVWDGIPRGQRFDVVVATLPHKPTVGTPVEVPYSQAGGRDGLELFDRLRAELADRLRPGGEFVTLIHSLPHPRFLAELGRAGHLRMLAWRRRYFREGEYGALQEGFLERSRRGDSLVIESEAGRYFLCGVWAWRASA